MGEKTDLLDDVSDLAAQPDRVPLGKVLSQNLYLSGAGSEEGVNQLEDGGLPRAASPDKDKSLTGNNLEVDPLHQALAAGHFEFHAPEAHGNFSRISHVQRFKESKNSRKKQ